MAHQERKLNEKQRKLLREVSARRKLHAHVLQTQGLLLKPGVPPSALRLSALVLVPNEYEEVVTERANEALCGYPICNNPIKKRSWGACRKYFSMEEKVGCKHEKK